MNSDKKNNQILNNWTERVKKLNKSIPDTKNFDLFINSYIDLINSILFFENYYTNKNYQFVDTIYTTILLNNALITDEKEGVSNQKGKEIRIIDTNFETHLKKIKGSLEEVSSLSLFDDNLGSSSDKHRLYQKGRRIIEGQGHSLTKDDLRSILGNENEYKRLPEGTLNEILEIMSENEIVFDSESGTFVDGISEWKIKEVNVEIDDKKFKGIELIKELFEKFREAYGLFCESCDIIENQFSRIKQLGEYTLNNMIENQNEILQQIQEKLDESPPAEIKGFSDLLSKYVEGRTLLSYYLKWDFEEHISSIARISILSYTKSTDNYSYNLLEKSIEIPWDFNSSYLIVNEDIREKTDSMKLNFEKLIFRIRELNILSDLSQTVLIQLEKMKPDFPVFLARLAELVDMNKETTEKALIYLLRKHPELGNYDEMSQVLMFSKPQNVSILIDELLKQYSSNKEKN